MTDDLQRLFEENNIINLTAKTVLEPVQDDIPDNLLVNIIPTAIFVDHMLSFTKIGIYISSSYRSPKHNKMIGGSKTSQHIKFNALDIHAFDRKNTEKLWRYLDNIKEINLLFPYKDTSFSYKQMGIGYYNWGCHIDTRGLFGREGAEWDERM